MGRKLKPNVILEFAVYKDVGDEISSWLDKTKNIKHLRFASVTNPHLEAIKTLCDNGRGTVEKIAEPVAEPDVTIFKITRPDFICDDMIVFEEIGKKTGTPDSGHPYHSLVIKELYDQKTDFGMVQGKDCIDLNKVRTVFYV